MMGDKGDSSGRPGEGWGVGGMQGASVATPPHLAPGPDLQHWLLLHVLRVPDKGELRLLADLLKVVGPQGQGLGVHTPGSQALGATS